jgi:hypothetical protein
MHADKLSAWHDDLTSRPLHGHPFTKERFFSGFPLIIVGKQPVHIPEIAFHFSGNGNGSPGIMDSGIFQIAAEYYAVPGRFTFDASAQLSGAY